MTNFPKVAVILYGFNSARFVERTVRSLLSQDYADIEFFFSDDGSTDGSFEAMRAACAASQRTVQFNRNDANLGICQQINLGVARTTAPLIMLANADDLYPEDYITTLVSAWATHTPSPTVVWAELAQIDENDAPLNRTLPQRLAGESLSARIASRAQGPGATGVLLDRRVFSEFGPLPENLMLEDACLNARAFMLGPALQIRRPLVQYRVHSGNISQVYKAGEFDQWRQRHKVRAVWQSSQGHRAYVEMLRDLYQRPADRIEAKDLKQARWVAVEKIVETALLADYYADDQTVPPSSHWSMVWRLGLLQLKLTLKRWFPSIQARNLRWEFDQYTKKS